jgi:hypothetical protein
LYEGKKVPDTNREELRLTIDKIGAEYFYGLQEGIKRQKMKSSGQASKKFGLLLSNVEHDVE